MPKKKKLSSELPGPTRRQFLLTAGSTVAAGVMAAYTPAHAAASVPDESTAPADAHGPDIEGTVPITLRINGKDHQLRIDPRTTLLDCLRETVALTGTKKGCDHGQCGACTVHVNGRRVLSCLNFAVMHDGEQPSRAWVHLRQCIPCRRRSSPTMLINAVIALRVRSCPRSPC